MAWKTVAGSAQTVTNGKWPELLVFATRVKLEGRITDPSGGVVTGAEVTAKNSDTRLGWQRIVYTLEL